MLGESYVFIEILSLNKKFKVYFSCKAKNPKKLKCKWEVKSRDMKRKEKKKFYELFESAKFSFFYYTYHCTVPNKKLTLTIFWDIV